MAAVICPKCNYANSHGALFCHNCYTLLLDTIRVNPSGVLAMRSTTPGRVMTDIQVQRQTEANQLPSYAVSLYLVSAKIPLTTPVVVLLTKPIIIGRTESEEQMYIDLSRYGAAERGVSRQHLILRRVEPSVMAEDMGSSNGTWLNDVLLQPYRPAEVESGSVLRLGKFSIEVYMAQ
jgi:pSer/pThr/pTyr-binding forkhead associated (FHA) protein